MTNTSQELDNSLDGSDIGHKIRAARRGKKWTLEETAQRAQIGRSTLSKIELNQTRPSFDIISRLTKALDMHTPNLFLQSGHAGLNGRRDLTKKGQGEIAVTKTYSHELLCTDLVSKSMIPYISTITARDPIEFTNWIRHEGEEFMYVLSGELEFHTEHYKPVVMEAGDSIYYDSSMGHGCVSLSKEDAKVLWVSLETINQT